MRIPAATCVLMGVALAGAGAQTPAVPDQQPVQQYLFIDAQTARSKLWRVMDFSKVRERLVDAGNNGYGVHFMARSSTSVNMLLKRDGGGPRSYRLVATPREGALLIELNQAASEGFGVLADGIRAFEEHVHLPAGIQTTWIAVMSKASDAPRFKYAVVKGTKEGEQALGESVKTGRLLKGILGRKGMIATNTLLFFEEFEERKGAPTVTGQRQYRIIATSRTSSMQRGLIELSAEGFRVTEGGSGEMTVVMARDAGSTPEPIEYRLIAMTLVKNMVKELEEAGAEGFRIAAIPDHPREFVFILQRTPGTSERFAYQVLRLQEATANRMLLDAEADGYRIAALLDDLVVLERPL